MTPEDRAWEVVRRAYEERTPAPPDRRRASSRLLLAGVAAAGAIAAAVALVTPPGHAVLERVRRAVGIEHAAPALVSLPAQGRLLVVSVGRRRRLGRQRGRPEAAARQLLRRDVVAARPLRRRDDAHRPGRRSTFDTACAGRSRARGATWPRWEGTVTDTRIAYMTPHGLRVVAGDGTGDHLLDRFAGDVPPAWDPARLHTLAYYSGGAILLRNADTGRLVWRAPVTVTPSSLAWSSDGRMLAVVSPQARGRPRRRRPACGGRSRP